MSIYLVMTSVKALQPLPSGLLLCKAVLGYHGEVDSGLAPPSTQFLLELCYNLTRSRRKPWIMRVWLIRVVFWIFDFDHKTSLMLTSPANPLMKVITLLMIHRVPTNLLTDYTK